MNQKTLVPIIDKLAREKDISEKEFNEIKKYIAKANSSHLGDTDDVVSRFVLAVLERYNPDIETKSKASWIYNTVKGYCFTESKGERNAFYFSSFPSTLSISDNGEEMSNNLSDIEFEHLKTFIRMNLSGLELEIYEKNILGNTTLTEIAKDNNTSVEWISVLRERLIERLRFVIENYLQ